MPSAQLVVSIVGFAVTFGTLLYKFGRLEGKIMQKLEDHDRRLDHLEEHPTSRYAGV